MDGQLLEVLADLGLEFERVEAGAYLVTLRLPHPVHVWLLAGEQDVAVEVFVLHVLEGAPTDRLHAHLLTANRLLRGVHFCLDDVGDVFLTGSLALSDVTGTGLDLLLGEVHAVLTRERPRILRHLYGEKVPEKALLDGAGRRAAGVPDGAPRRDARR